MGATRTGRKDLKQKENWKRIVIPPILLSLSERPTDTAGHTSAGHFPSLFSPSSQQLRLPACDSSPHLKAQHPGGGLFPAITCSRPPQPTAYFAVRPPSFGLGSPPGGARNKPVLEGVAGGGDGGGEEDDAPARERERQKQPWQSRKEGEVLPPVEEEEGEVLCTQ